eukprot:s749_g2.t1
MTDVEALSSVKTFVYDLPAPFHTETLKALKIQAAAQGSDCDFGLTLCNSHWTRSFTHKHIYASEVVFLQKLLRAVPLTEDPSEADLFVVPWLVRSHCAVREVWDRCIITELAGLLWHYLPHFNESTRGRHLFFASGGPPNLPMDVQAQPLQVTLGPDYFPPGRPHFVSGRILVPYLSNDPFLQPGAWQSWKKMKGMRKDIWVCLAFSLQNIARHVLLDSFKAATEGNVTLAWPGPIRIIGFNRKMTAVGTPTDETTPRELLKLLSRSRFCVVPPADTSSIGKRFYDAVLTECIPVVIAFPTKYGLGKSWWTFDGTPVEWSLPFAQQGLDYSKLAIEIPVEELRRGNAVAYLAAVSEAVVAKRLAYLRAVRNHLIFDYSGETIDAFSLAVRQLLSLLPTARAAPVRCLDLPRLDDTPWSSEEKKWIDGVNRQAWGIVECYFVAGRLPVGRGPGFRNILSSSPAVSEDFSPAGPIGIPRSRTRGPSVHCTRWSDEPSAARRCALLEPDLRRTSRRDIGCMHKCFQY